MSRITNQTIQSEQYRRLREAVQNAEPIHTPPPAKPVSQAAPAGFAENADRIRQTFGTQVGAHIHAGKLAHLKEKLEDGLVAAIRDAGARFRDANFGHVAQGSGPTQLKDLAGARSRNPLDGMPQLTLGRDAMLSEDPAQGADGGHGEGASAREGFFASLAEAVKAGASEAGRAVGALLGAISSTAIGVMSANTESPEDKKNEANGIIGLARQGRTGTIHEQAHDYRDVLNGTDKTPVPDDTGESSGPPRIITAEMLRGIQARKNAAGTPTGEEAGSGGSLNTGASGTGRQASLSQPLPDGEAARAAVTRADLVALEVRILSRIQIVP